jgi:hypothetical protein
MRGPEQETADALSPGESFFDLPFYSPQHPRHPSKTQHADSIL